VEIIRWRALAMENSAEAITYDQMLQNQGEELFFLLNEIQLSMV
jgi:hypothetical protein